MTSAQTLRAQLVSLASAIRSKTGGGDALTIAQMRAAVNALNTISGTAAGAFIGYKGQVIADTGSSYFVVYSSYNEYRIEKLHSTATSWSSFFSSANDLLFAVRSPATLISNGIHSQTNLRFMDFPNLTSKGNSSAEYFNGSFPNCSLMSFPAMSTVYTGTFRCNAPFATLNLAAATTIHSSAIRGSYACLCIPQMTYIMSAYAISANIPRIYAPKLITAYDYAFFYNMSLTSITSDMFPALQTIKTMAFYRCDNIKHANFPAVKTFNGIGATVPTLELPSCTALNAAAGATTLRVPVVQTIGSTVLNYASLTTLDMRSVPSVPVLSKSIPSCGLSKAGASIYVPSSLYDAFRTTAYWSSLAARFLSA